MPYPAKSHIPYYALSHSKKLMKCATIINSLNNFIMSTIIFRFCLQFTVNGKKLSCTVRAFAETKFSLFS